MSTLHTDIQNERENTRIQLGKEASNAAYNLKQVDWTKFSERERSIIIDVLERCAIELFVRTPVPVASQSVERKVVSMFISPDNSVWQGRAVAACDDGSVWETFTGDWTVSLPPIPGTAAAKAAEVSNG